MEHPCLVVRGDFFKLNTETIRLIPLAGPNDRIMLMRNLIVNCKIFSVLPQNSRRYEFIEKIDDLCRTADVYVNELTEVNE
jgi:hypothetical protein